jgi:hypothetical protein
MCEWPARCTFVDIMKVQLSAVWVSLALASATVAAQSSQVQSSQGQSNQGQSSQGQNGQRVTSSTTGRATTTAGSTASAGSTTTVGSMTSQASRRPAEAAPLQLPSLGRPNPEAASLAAGPNGEAQCPTNSSTSTARATSSSAFPGVSASQFPRAGVSADAFVRPGVSAAQLSTLLPGARTGPCAPPRDVILYPDTGTPARRVPPTSEDGPG